MDLLEILHSLSLFYIGFYLYVARFFVWITKKRGKWKTDRIRSFLSTFFVFSTRVFHSQPKCKNANGLNTKKRKSKRCFWLVFHQSVRFFSICFPHHVVIKRAAKTATSILLGAFPQFPQALLILLFTIYIILSL